VQPTSEDADDVNEDKENQNSRPERAIY